MIDFDCEVDVSVKKTSGTRCSYCGVMTIKMECDMSESSGQKDLSEGYDGVIGRQAKPLDKRLDDLMASWFRGPVSVDPRLVKELEERAKELEEKRKKSRMKKIDRNMVRDLYNCSGVQVHKAVQGGKDVVVMLITDTDLDEPYCFVGSDEDGVIREAMNAFMEPRL